ncbi:MAG TPA: TM2 domain-containing protein [Candidatus Angelobacter sp.]|nr:TM2 domain-containing protein [Candidatus Angelobacter sp.]
MSQQLQSPSGLAGDATRMMRYDANKKSAVVAYLLWFFVGMLGAHRFYLGRIGSGIAILVLTILSWILAFVAIGLLLLIIPGIWVLIDLFLIPGMVRAFNNRLITELAG